ncbi:VOC family protein [Ornithinimicrobium pratense]|uniref:VOC family protein n=1 Tax=Ornithinimicrobium pratense TaxID=2593973 RepID=A0A5J6V9T7_9MICO|nr:VOC family protein [Ornithinimicrobium pratense]QFG69996.1 VOC family protein [Ornithinimicrobium pratense]
MATWFAYEYCTDIAATRKFYGELVGLDLIWDEPEDIAFRHDCVQLSFRFVDSLERPMGWAFQPGWGHGQLPNAPTTEQVRSISIALPPVAFGSAVTRLKAAGVPALRPEPFWVGYWSFVVQDPDGQTVELTDPESPQELSLDDGPAAGR